jgi:hypothetical protein
MLFNYLEAVYQSAARNPTAMFQGAVSLSSCRSLARGVFIAESLAQCPSCSFPDLLSELLEAGEYLQRTLISGINASEHRKCVSDAEAKVLGYSVHISSYLTRNGCVEEWRGTQVYISSCPARNLGLLSPRSKFCEPSWLANSYWH